MTDQELLILAAKAAGFILKEIKISMPIGTRKGVSIDEFSENEWNPLEDDGDAFRLANKLDMTVLFGQTPMYIEDSPYACASALTWINEMPFTATSQETYRGSKSLVAARRAIVHTAAKIGKALND